jgi:hypothetical protein
MKHSYTNHKGFSIQKTIDVKTHTCLIYKDGSLVKCIAGGIAEDGSEDSIEKAKEWINNQ